MKNFYIVAYLSGVADSFFGRKLKLHVHSYVANSSAEALGFAMMDDEPPTNVKDVIVDEYPIDRLQEIIKEMS